MQVNEYEIGAPEAWLDMRRFFSDGIADFITELAETVEQNAPGKAHTSNHFAEYETLGFDYLKAASGFVDYPGIGFILAMETGRVWDSGKRVPGT